MNLKELQQAFMAALIDSQHGDNQLLSAIHSSLQLPAQQRLAIYRDSMIESFIKALAETYPVTLQLVGEEFFRFMAKRYISQTPSADPDLGEYGESFPNFIARFELAKTITYLADVAKLEWCYYRVYHGPSALPFDFQVLAAVPAELQPEIVFQLPNNCFLLESKFPVSRIWQIHQPDYENEFSVDFNIDMDRLVIYKIEDNISINPLSLSEWALLNKFKKNEALGKLNDSEISLLAEIMNKKLIANFKISDY